MQQGCHQSLRVHPFNPIFLTNNDDSNEPTIPYGFGRQLPIVPPSLNDLNLPPNPFKILATMAIATNTGDESYDNFGPQSPEPSEHSPISTLPMNVSPFQSWETSYTTTDNDTFYSSDEPRGIYFRPPSPASPPSPPRKLKRRLSLECPFQKRGECRSTSAKPAVRRSPQQRTPQVHQTGIRTVETLKLTHKLGFYLLKHLLHHLLINLCLGYVVDTYIT